MSFEAGARRQRCADGGGASAPFWADRVVISGTQPPALHVTRGDAAIAGRVACNTLALPNSSVLFYFADWQPYAVQCLTADVSLLDVRHARFRQLNNSVTVDVDVDVLIGDAALTQHVDLSLPVNTPHAWHRVAACMLRLRDAQQSDLVIGYTLAHASVPGALNVLRFCAPAFAPGRWTLGVQLEYEV